MYNNHIYLTNSRSWSSEYVLEGSSYVWIGGGGGGVEKGHAQLKQGFHFFTFWDKEADFFLSLNWTF